DGKKTVSILYAPSPVDAAAAGNGARAAANLAIALRGDQAAESLYVLPTEANVNGARDMGVDPQRLPGRVAAERPGMDFAAMVDAAIDGRLKAMVVVGDNPLMFAPGKERVRRALESLELLIVVDSLMTETARLAHVVLADVPAYGKTGTFTNAERRVNRLHAAMDALGDARPAQLALLDLAVAYAGSDVWTYAHPDAVTDEIAERVRGYERYRASHTLWGKSRVFDLPSTFERQTVTPVAEAVASGQLLLTTGRTLFTSLEGAAIRSADADKLHREEFVEIHPRDAADLRVADEQEVTLVSEHGELTLRAKISGRVHEGVAFVPYYYDGGAAMALLGANGAPVPVMVKVAALA
ncbi:MAG TPA: molybdopterin dinucleotide binding domain-containing protein, partial [Candidatus Tectomicrobia bacterium]|nr:molybdopterin dinucleotide binding domain-containing protein [Candidatus Tectomicrobia bacterium]